MFPGTQEMQQDDKLLGRERPDVNMLFPKYTHASAATTGEVVVNGTTLKLWTYAQLEALNVLPLRQRANAIREAIGQDQCPPIPSSQTADLVRWILHMQAELTKEKISEGRSGGYGNGHNVPHSFAQDSKVRPITSRSEAAEPNAPRYDHDAARDHYSDLLQQRNEFTQARTEGIVTMREGGEGRRHIPQKDRMVSLGVSDVAAHTQGEGRRYIGCQDNFAQQSGEARTQGIFSTREGGEGRRCSKQTAQHVSGNSMFQQGCSAPEQEPHIGGDRRRHTSVQDHMVNHGTAEIHEEEVKPAGRKYMDGFAGSPYNHGSSHDQYKSNWKKDPSKLLGTSLLC